MLGKAFRGDWPREKVKIWTPEITKTAKRMWAAGCSASIIAKAFDITSGAVLAKASREKWPRPRNVKIQRVKYGSLSEQSGRTP